MKHSRTREEQKRFVLQLVAQILLGLGLIAMTIIVGLMDNDCPVFVGMIGAMMVVSGFAGKLIMAF